MTRNQLFVASAVASSFVMGRPSFAALTYYNTFVSWSSQVSSYETIDFVSEQPFVLSDQYSSQGVLFPDANDWVVGPTAVGDHWGVIGSQSGSGGATILFSAPQSSCALSFASLTKANFYSGDTFLGQGTAFSSFLGVTSDIAFDRIEIVPVGGGFYLDNLHYSTVPAPGAAAWAVAAVLFARGRNRRR